MLPETIFTVCNYGVLPAWLLLAFAPGWSFTQRLVHQVWIPMLLGAVYLGILVFGPPPPEGADFFSLHGVMTFFTSPWAVVMGWVHYLVFDLFVGAWEVRDAKRRQISHWLVVPCLGFTLMFGPVGLLAYLALRFGMKGAVTLEE
ncbi:MAG: ABA4-like family protein [Myxococcota bacterium]|jgi:hypothetical protein|nr:ABA4-like family protein [Myxococcota bacterium]